MDRITLIVLLLSFFVNAQTLLSERYSNFTPNLPDSTVFALLLTDASDSLTVDISDSIKTAATINGWASYSAFADSLNGDNPFVPGGTSIQWNRTDGYLSYAAGAMDTLDMGATGVTIFFIAQNWEQFSGTGDLSGLISFRRNLTAAAQIGYMMNFRGGAPYNGIYLRVADGTNYTQTNCTASVTSTLNDSSWHVYAARWGKDGQKTYIDGAEVASGTATFNPGIDHNGEYFIGTGVDGTGNPAGGHYFVGKVAYVLIVQDSLAQNDIKKIGFLASGWAGNSGGAFRADSSDGFKFQQGIITDTLYYNTALTAGSWSISVDVDGNSGGETYRILTSADKSTWSDLGSGTAPAASTTKTFTGTGLGYIGLGVSSAADTVFFDNLTVTLQPANATGKFKGNSSYDKFKGW